MSTKSDKSKSKGNGIDEKDATEIIAGVQARYEKIPAFIRPTMPALPDILRRIPSSAGKYTLNEIIQLPDEAYATGPLKQYTGRSRDQPSIQRYHRFHGHG